MRTARPPSVGRSIVVAPTTMPSVSSVRRWRTASRARAPLRARKSAMSAAAATTMTIEITQPRRVGSARASVGRHGRIDLGAPPVDTAGKIPHTVEALADQELRGSKAANAVMAVQHDLAIPRQLGHRCADASEWNHASAFDSTDAPFVRFAHVDDIERVSALYPGGELPRYDLSHARVACGRHGGPAATEFIVVDQRLQLARSAGRAFGIPA